MSCHRELSRSGYFCLLAREGRRSDTIYKQAFARCRLMALAVNQTQDVTASRDSLFLKIEFCLHLPSAGWNHGEEGSFRLRSEDVSSAGLHALLHHMLHYSTLPRPYHEGRGRTRGDRVNTDSFTVGRGLHWRQGAGRKRSTCSRHKTADTTFQGF